MDRVPHCKNCKSYIKYDYGFNVADRKNIITSRCGYEDNEKDLNSRDMINSPKWCPIRKHK